MGGAAGNWEMMGEGKHHGYKDIVVAEGNNHLSVVVAVFENNAKDL